MHFTGTTVRRLQDGKIVQEIGLDDGVTAPSQLGLIKAVNYPSNCQSLKFSRPDRGRD